MKKVKIIKRFVDKDSVRRGKAEIVELTKDGEKPREFPDARADELIKNGYAEEVKEPKAAKKTEE